MRLRTGEVFDEEIRRPHGHPTKFPPTAIGVIPFDFKVSIAFSKSANVLGSGIPYLSKRLFL